MRSLELLAPGIVLPYAGSTAPTGWLLCSGQAVSRTTYAALFAVIGTAFGTGDGSATFNVPDLRGEFVRGLDNGRGVDSGRLLGTAQKGTHITADDGDDANKAVQAMADVTQIEADPADGTNRKIYYLQNTTPEVISLTTPSFQRQVRPRNVAMNHVIKT